MRSTIVLALALAACSRTAKTEPAAGAAIDVAALSADGSMGARLPATATPPVRKGAPADAPHRRADALVFPSAFQGHWGLTEADCDISRPDAPGLMKVRGDKLDFHDATATVHGMPQRRQDRVVVYLGYADHRKGWRRETLIETLMLEVGGTRLARTDAAGTHHYEHC